MKKVYPLKPQFYIVKLGYTGVNMFFLIFAPKHGLWVLVSLCAADLRICLHIMYAKSIRKLTRLAYFSVSPFCRIKHGNKKVACQNVKNISENNSVAVSRYKEKLLIYFKILLTMIAIRVIANIVF